MPITITITMIILYLLLGSYIFSYTEGWPGMTGFYFSYVTLSTIGFGDYSPGQNLSDPKLAAEYCIPSNPAPNPLRLWLCNIR